MRVTVLVPTYRRQADLERCLAALRAQIRPPDAVIVALRIDDHSTEVFLDDLSLNWTDLQPIVVDRPGVVAAMNAGLATASGDVLALTDDDAEPAPDWLARIVEVFEARSEVAGVGGRDVQVGRTEERADVGRVQWFGRVIGNHHLGVGEARDVDVLKGVNCAFRLEPLRKIGFDERLRGSGAQVHWELSLCLALRRAGWHLVYDPEIRVVHHVAPRHDDDQLHRGKFDPAPLENAVFNETLVLAGHLSGARGAAFRVWSRLVGTASEPGLLQLPRIYLKEGAPALKRWQATQRARSAAFGMVPKEVSSDCRISQRGG